MICNPMQFNCKTRSGRTVEGEAEGRREKGGWWTRNPRVDLRPHFQAFRNSLQNLCHASCEELAPFPLCAPTPFASRVKNIIIGPIDSIHSINVPLLLLLFPPL